MDAMQGEPGRVLKELLAQSERGNCILFLGSGVHAPPPEGSKYSYLEEHRPPIGGELAEKLSEEFQLEEALPEDSLWDLQRVSMYIETEPAWGRKRLVDALEKHLKEDKKPSPALHMLAKLPFKIFITTNYDLLLDDALSDANKKPFPTVYSPKAGERARDMSEDPTEERPLLFKMHGDLDHRESIVITDEDYITFVQRMTEKRTSHPVPETILFRMLRWPTIFVGYSLRDYNLRLLFRTLRWKLDRSEVPTSFSIDRNPDPLIMQVWQNERRFVTFVAQDLWKFAPWLYESIHGKEYPA